MWYCLKTKIRKDKDFYEEAWDVGFYNPDGEWISFQIERIKGAAIALVARLNGGE